MIVPLSVGVVWLAASVGLYIMWPALMPEYLADLMPALVLLSAVGALSIWQWKRLAAQVVFIILFIACAASLTLSYRAPLTGVYSRESLVKAAALLNDQVTLSEPILTGAVLVPFLSGHQVYGNITHPLWYSYNFIDPNTRRAFLPSIEQIQQHYDSGKIKWVLTDTVTNAAYFSNQLTAPWDEPDKWKRAGAIKNSLVNNRNSLLLWQGANPSDGAV